jgi:erythromycin esterase-like protein
VGRFAAAPTPHTRRSLAPTATRAFAADYRPETELQSHYFQAALPHQFDEYIGFDRTTPIHPIAAHKVADIPDTYPFGL